MNISKAFGMVLRPFLPLKDFTDLIDLKSIAGLEKHSLTEPRYERAAPDKVKYRVRQRLKNFHLPFFSFS